MHIKPISILSPFAFPAAGSFVAAVALLSTGTLYATPLSDDVLQKGANVASNANPALSRAARHALIVGVGEYTNPAITSLKGVRHDMESARKMAIAMAIPPGNIRYIRDYEATAERIEKEITELNTRTHPCDRVFFYFSGHGTRWYDPAIKKEGCIEALMASDGKTLTNSQVATLLKPISDKADKLMVFYDACHSGGIVDQSGKTRSANPVSSRLTPKFSGIGTPELCSKPVNIKTRSFTSEAQRIGGLPQNIVQISSSRPDEISFDDESRGGLATQGWSDCMLGEAQDMDGSGGISVAEIAACVQAKLDYRFSNNHQYAAQHITIGGNKSFIPGWFTTNFAEPQTALDTATSTQAATQSIAFVAQQPVITNAPAALPIRTPDATLTDVFAQRDARRKVTVHSKTPFLRIGKDLLDLSVTSSHTGYVYMILLGSDNKSFYMLFPNDIDRNNRINAGETLQLPRKDWEITAQGPAGLDKMLVVVTESPRNPALLGNARSGPFLQTLTDHDGRANLQWLLGTSMNQASVDCSTGGVIRTQAVANNCSDAFGAALIDIIEK